MKKCISVLLVFFSLAAFVNAQDLVSKKGIPILPEQGEWAIGADAFPFFYYLGNFFNDNYGNGAPEFNFTDNYPMTLYAKYMVDPKTAFRVKLQLTYNSSVDKEYVIKDALVIDLDDQIEDKAKRSYMDIVIGAGLEKRRGKGRLQGIYGAEALVMFGSEKSVFEYGNNWNPDIQHHVADFGDNINYEEYGIVNERKSGMSLGFQVRGFVGVEYFFAPKMSIGGEFGWGLGLAKQGEGELSYEYLDYVNEETIITSETEKTAGGSSFGVSTDNLSGAINLLFYF
ncbi:MAG: hypothetical protein V1775_12935 [Bacteroidota bacterium]